MRIASCVAAGMGFWVTTGISGGALAQCADKLEPIKNQYWLFPAWFEPSSASLAKRCRGSKVTRLRAPTSQRGSRSRVVRYQLVRSVLWMRSCFGRLFDKLALATFFRAAILTKFVRVPYSSISRLDPVRGLVRRRDLHTDAQRPPVLGRDHGLVQSEGSGVEAIEHNGCRLLRHGAGGGDRPLRQA